MRQSRGRFVGLFVFGLVLHVGAAEASGGESLSVIHVPGGLRAFACGAGLPDSLPPARLLPALARRDTSMTAGTPESLRAAQYLGWLRELQARVRATGSERDLVFRLGSRRERSAVSGVVDWLGLRLVSRNGAFALSDRDGELDIERQMFAACVGASSELLTQALQRQQPARLWPDDGGALSPVPVSVWRSIPTLARRGPNDLLFGLVEDRRAQLLYHGLMGLDDETLAWLTSSRLLRTIYEDRSASFAAFGHALRVSRGAVSVPGGDRYRARWAALVDRDPAHAEQFVTRLLSRDDGVLADFFATLYALPEPTQAAVVGAADFERLYEAFRRASSAWKIEDSPFGRPASDPGFVLLMLLADGTAPLAGPGWRHVWNAGFEGRALSSKDAQLASDLARSDHVDLAWLLSSITSSVESLDSRLGLARFARRVFDDVDPAQAGHAAVALGAFQDMPILLLELERAGVRSPAVFARVAERARKLADERPERGALTMVAWQGAIAIVCALSTGGAISGDVASALVDELSTLPQGRDDLWDGAVARFMRDRVGPLIGAPHAGGDGRGVEDALLGALARTRGAKDGTFTWEGLEYRTTVTEARAARTKAIARAQVRLPLDDLLALISAADGLQSAMTAAQVKAAMEPLSGIEERFPPDVPWLFETKERPLRPASFIERQLRDARRIERDKDASRGGRAVDRLVWLTDLLTADTLSAILYAAKLGVGLQTPATVAAAWRRHEFGFRGAEGEIDRSLAWQAPRIGALPDGGWHMRGSLIGLDLALGESWLRRLAGGPVPSPTRLSDPDLQILFRSHATSVLSPPLERAPAWTARTIDLAAVSEPRRRRLLSWIQASAPDRLEGAAVWHDSAGSKVPDAWGTAPEDGSCLCRQSLVRRPAEAWLGRPLRATVVPLVPDLNLRVSAMAAEIGLPPIAIPAVMAAAYQDWIDGASLAYRDDWESLASFANALTRARFEEYVFALIATRELTPAQRVP